VVEEPNEKLRKTLVPQKWAEAKFEYVELEPPTIQTVKKNEQHW